MNSNRFLFKVLTFLLFTGCVGCVKLLDGRPPGPWHEAYEAINDPESEAFVARALERATRAFGDPEFPVNKVLLRRSRPLPEAARYRIGRDFSLTECVDPTNGIFVVYLAVDPGHRNYYPLLGHECAHLLNPYILDWYMEGAAMVFSEQMCIDTGREWGNWTRHFMKSRFDPYALSYRMMRELKEELPGEYPRIIRFFSEKGDGPNILRVDIDSWLEILPEDRRQRALEIISDYAKQLKKQDTEKNCFTVPKGLEEVSTAGR